MKDLEKRSTLYHEDFARWCEQTAEALREGNCEEIDIEMVAEEIEDMAKRDRRELRSRIIILINHLLKWQAQPTLLWLKKASWESTIREQRRQIIMLLDDSPSLRYKLAVDLETVYRESWKEVDNEMSLMFRKETPPPECPYSLDEILDPKYFPSGPFRQRSRP